MHRTVTVCDLHVQVSRSSYPIPCFSTLETKLLLIFQQTYLLRVTSQGGRLVWVPLSWGVLGSTG